MTSLTPDLSTSLTTRDQVDLCVNNLLECLPDIEQLSRAERRGIIARYTAVLEGNFIYWMTGAYLSASSEEARSLILENLREEVRDCHPGMLRRFAIAANAVPTDSDSLSVYRELLRVRLFIGRLSPLPILIMMMFFEAFIQKFMPYLADLARREGSVEQEYTDVHGTCDVIHTQELYKALESEMAFANGSIEQQDLLEGVELLDSLIRTVITGPKAEG